mgnify:CR=1 FL=1
MKTSGKGIAFIAEREGVVTRAYRDVAGVWTIGIGHTAAAGSPRPAAGLTITREEAFDILAADLPAYERRAREALGPVPQSVFDGAVSFDFNSGAIARASWVRAYRAGDRDGARKGLMRWTRAGGRVVPGLVQRREAEARLIFEGDYGVGQPAGWSVAMADVAAYQKQLAALGFYRGAIDGLAGPETRAAVEAYQRSHPDLVVDGIVGPATRASLARDLAARTGAAAVVAGGVAASVVGAAAMPAHALAAAIAVGCAVLALAGGALAYRYRGEVRRFIRSKLGA